MIDQLNIYGLDKVEVAIGRIKQIEPRGGSWYLAFSGGKDSCVIKALCDMATVKERLKEFERYPKYKQAYINAFKRMIALQIEGGNSRKWRKAGKNTKLERRTNYRPSRVLRVLSQRLSRT